MFFLNIFYKLYFCEINSNVSILKINFLRAEKIFFDKIFRKKYTLAENAKSAILSSNFAGARR